MDTGRAGEDRCLDVQVSNAMYYTVLTLHMTHTVQYMHT